jgi:aryl sulfotransferase|tara:strand:+ start:6916 stop:7857 length:942 start_codon:yes stop_codon:yes gene_type:complete
LELPVATRVYQNHHLDSTRWDLFEPRSDDIVITTAYKSGTTWTQDIFYHLIYGDSDPLPKPDSVNVWPDANFMGIDRDFLKKWLAGFEKQRYIKSHLPLDGLPYFKEVRYVIVCRDPRDVFMSFFNHFSRYTEIAYARMNNPEVLIGDPLPACPEDPRELWKDWITRGWFEWESEGYPFWSNLHHTQTYWNYRHLPNFLFIHYNDMLADLEGIVRKLADFAYIQVNDEKVNRVVEATTFANVKKRIEAEQNNPRDTMFKGGSKTFFFKGTNGRWKDVLSHSDLTLYEQAKERELTRDCAEWLENGGSLPRLEG